MQSRLCRTRILALEIRLRRVGFAMFEEPDQLLDWGIRRWRVGIDPVLAIMRCVSQLLELYSPSAVVLKRLNGSRKARRRKRLIEAVMRQLVSYSTELRTRSKDPDVRHAFRRYGGRNKYEIADAIAETFPELRPKLPPKRKAYQPERYNAL